MKRCIYLLTVTFVLAFVSFVFSQAPTTLNDFTLPGSQPGESGNLEHPSKCDNCHGGYDLAVEPAFNWRGSMMSQAARDPLYFACLAISNQDAPESGDLCIRCHSPSGWLEGRSIPTDGSALNNNDREGVQCDFCHKLIAPTLIGVNPFPLDLDYTAGTYPQDQSYLAGLTAIPEHSANGMYIADANNAKRGPFVDASARHQMFYSPFHSESDICGTCHDVSNPVYIKVADGVYAPNEFDLPPLDQNPYTMFPVERTYSEWMQSDFFPDITCQDCHVRDVTGAGCNKKGTPIRTDLPLHDMTGGNTFIPTLIEQLFPGETDPAALQAGIQRAEQTLRQAAALNLSEVNDILTVRVTNLTGHKLPSGYPEGRRIWLNVKVLDENNGLIHEFGAYDPDTGVLQKNDTKVYEIKPGLSRALVTYLNSTPAFDTLSSGPSFHFVLNDTIFFDNRIPPSGFSNAAFVNIQSPPVGYTYGEGQDWDETDYDLQPFPGARSVEVTLYYQTTTKEYVEFLRDENHTNNWGQVFYDLWNTNGKSAPVVMNNEVFILPVSAPPVAEFMASPISGDAPLTVSFTDLSTNLPTSWAWDFGDGGTSIEQNPSYTYNTQGTYDVSLIVTNSFGSDEITKTGYISVTTATQTYIHVQSITVTAVPSGGPNWVAQAEVQIFDQNENPIPDALVEGVFDAPNTRLKSGTTDASGVALIISDKTKNPPTNWCFDVTNVSKTGTIYDPNANVVISACTGGTPLMPGFTGMELLPNSPNPFNPETRISFYLPEAQTVELAIYNIRGQVVARLMNGFQSAGLHQIDWNAMDQPSGIYIMRLQSREKTLIKKINLIK
jgi:PKD repeat protein